MQATISENKGWFYFLGILLVILGIAAVAFPFVTTIAAKVFLGWLFLIAGIVQVLALLSLLLVLISGVRGEADTPQLWALVAIALQVMALTFFMMQRSK